MKEAMKTFAPGMLYTRRNIFLVQVVFFDECGFDIGRQAVVQERRQELPSEPGTAAFIAEHMAQRRHHFRDFVAVVIAAVAARAEDTHDAGLAGIGGIGRRMQIVPYRAGRMRESLQQAAHDDLVALLARTTGAVKVHLRDLVGMGR